MTKIYLTPLAFAAALLFLLAPVASAKPGDLYIGLNLGGVLKIHPNGTKTGAQSVLADGSEFTYNGGGDFGVDGRLYVSDYGASGIQKMNLATGTIDVFIDPLFQSLSDVEYHPNGFLYASDFSNEAIYEVNSATGDATTLAEDFELEGDTYALVVGPSGTIYVADYSGRVVSVHPNTGNNQTLISDDTDLAGAIGIAVTPDESRIFVTTGEEFFRVNPDGPVSSNARVLLQGPDLLSSSYDLAWTLSGKLLSTNDLPNGQVIEINPANGDQRVAFKGDLLIGTAIEGITVEPPKCGGKTATYYGTPKRDVIVGSPYPDVIASLGGDDLVKGLGDKDFICGGGGRDWLVGGKGRDRLFGGAGKDKTIQ